MRNLYLAISLILFTTSELAFAEVDAITDVTLTQCLTTRVKFNQNALQPYKADELSLKVDDTISDDSYVEPISQNNGVFSWEKAIPIGKKLMFTVLKDDEPISQPFSKGTQEKLASVITTPTQLAEADVDESVVIRGIGKDTSKKEIPITIPKDLVNKEVLVIITSEYGKLLWQHYGSGDSKLTAEIPSESSHREPRIIARDTVCPR